MDVGGGGGCHPIAAFGSTLSSRSTASMYSSGVRPSLTAASADDFITQHEWRPAVHRLRIGATNVSSHRIGL
jgi:hypothetical protein